MSECFLLFKGWDSPDSSPALEKVFGTYEKALAFAKELEDAESKRHIESYGEYPGCTSCWHEIRNWNTCYTWYQSRHFIRFGLSAEDIKAQILDNREMSDETICIERREIE